MRHVQRRVLEDARRRTRLQVVEEEDRLDLVVVQVAQAASVAGDGERAIGRDGELLDAVEVGREPADLLRLDLDAEQSGRRLVRLVFDHLRRVLLVVLQRRLAPTGVLLGDEDERVLPGPCEVRDAARAVGERPRLAAGRVEEPDLRLRVVVGLASLLALVVFLLGRGPAAQEGQMRPVRRPARRRATLRPARQLHLSPRGAVVAEELGDVGVLLLVHGGPGPYDEPPVRRKCDRAHLLLVDHIIRRPVGVDDRRRGGTRGRGRQGEEQQREQSSHGGPRFAGGRLLQ